MLVESTGLIGGTLNAPIDKYSDEFFDELLRKYPDLKDGELPPEIRLSDHEIIDRLYTITLAIKQIYRELSGHYETLSILVDSMGKAAKNDKICEEELDGMRNFLSSSLRVWQPVAKPQPQPQGYKGIRE